MRRTKSYRRTSRGNPGALASLIARTLIRAGQTEADFMIPKSEMPISFSEWVRRHIDTVAERSGGK